MLKYPHKILAVLIILLSFCTLLRGEAAHGNEADKTDESYSFYLISCGSYIERRTSQENTDNDTADTFYVAGWISAYNRLTQNTHNIAEDTDLDSIMFWLEKYCRESPLSNLESGLYHLSTEEYPASIPHTAEKSPPATQPSVSPPPKFHELPF